MMKILPRILILSIVLFFAFYSTNVAASFSGAVFTTDSSCSGTDLNIYSAKENVYLSGGPTHIGSAGLPDGEYYVQVTTPNNLLLGTSIGSSDSTPVVVADGEFVSCYQLQNVVVKASDQTMGYDTTINSGGEYKVWISSDSNFSNSFSKTDNFKIITNNNGNEDPESGILNVIKFYDANANGINDDAIEIPGWLVRIQDGIEYYRFAPISMILIPDIYTITEQTPIETNWMNTTTNPVIVDLQNGDNETVEFGNLCLGSGGGHTLGYWSNKNGQKLISNDDLSLLSSLNLRNADGSSFNPTTYTQFRTWLLNGKATNMSYMLSVQMSASQMNVSNGFANSSSIIYAPGTESSNDLGFATLGDIINEANTELGLHGLVLAKNEYRQYQEALKNALDNANNNQSFVQATPCQFTFYEYVIY